MTLQFLSGGQAKPGTTEWWRDTLLRDLNERQARIDLYDNYYTGNQPLPYASRSREVFGGVFGDSPSNFCRLVVDATEERLGVEGFRFGSEEGDEDAWAIWQANNLDSLSQLAHTEALVKGESYALVWGSENGVPQITIEDPRQMVVAYSTENRWKRRAALKRWHDESGHVFVNLYLPDRIEKYRSINAVAQWLPTTMPGQGAWEIREPAVANPTGVVPVVPLINRPRLIGDGESEIADIIEDQDRLNKTLFDIMMAMEFASFRQRWATGIDIPLDENGEPIEPFKAAVDRLWVTSSTDAKFGDFEQTSIEGMLKMAETVIQHIATKTRTPPHYLLGQSGSFPSGESLKATETGMTAKVVSKQRFFGEAWEEVIRLAFRWQGDARADFPAAETIWRDAEYRAPGQWADALSKLSLIGVPREMLWEEWGFSPQVIARMKRMVTEDALLGLPVSAQSLPAAPPDQG